MKAIKITSSANDVLPVGNRRIFGVRLVSGSADAVASIFDEAAGVTGDAFCNLAVTEDAVGGTGQSHPAPDVQMFPGNGLSITNGVSITMSGTGAILYIYYA